MIKINESKADRGGSAVFSRDNLTGQSDGGHELVRGV